ncbi:MAG: hypothetical protein ABSC23_06815 [Bryobacteraceae bacterium]
MRILPFAGLLLMCVPQATDCAANLINDPSFEITKDRDQFGRVFATWDGWKYEGDCNFEVGLIPHTGKTSGMLACNSAGKIRIAQLQDLEPGRYSITAYIRGLEIGIGTYNQDVEFMFNEQYFQLKKSGTFGWTRLTYVVELSKPAKAGPSFGLWAPGLLWIDDVSMERVGPDVPLTAAPALGTEEAPIAPPGALGPGAVRCPRCAYRNMPEWKKCYACGSPLAVEQTAIAGPPVKPITSFEQDNPFSGGVVVSAHATDGAKALRIDKDYAAMIAPQDWSGYDYLKIDTYTDAPDALPLVIEIQDKDTKDYWTRVNYNAVAPPGQSTLILPLKGLYVGEKGRPGRNLILSGVTRLVVAISSAPPAPLFIDRLRLERDLAGSKAVFDGLYAFDFGPAGSPVMDGFTAITPATPYSPGRGYGLKNAKIWRALDALQPDPLYQDFLCIESGGLAVDVPNGAYRVFLNIDSPGGFWGENQTYRERSILAQGKKALSERMDLQSFEKKYFHFWDTEDLPTDNVFDKYGQAHFSEKTFDVAVTNGQLYLEFQGANWANCVSAVVIFPVEKAAAGAQFLEYVKERRRFYFDNAFKRVLPRATGDPLQATAEDARRGYVVYQRDLMGDLCYNGAPFRGELGKPLSADGFPGQETPLIMGVLPLKDLGRGEVSVSALTGPQGAIPASAIDVGYVSNRLSRVTMDGAVYTISPRLVLPRNNVAMPKDIARYFWLTVHTPPTAKPGVYTGQVTFTPRPGEAASMPLRFTVRRGALDPVDIPVGPFGGQIELPWFGDDPGAAKFAAETTGKSLHLLRARGFTMFTGVPNVAYHGFVNGKPALDFGLADRQMQEAKDLGFLAVDSYGAGIGGFDPYYQDTAKMQAAGFKDYSEFIRVVYAAVQQHAQEKGWLPVYWNLGDEPSGDNLQKSIANATAYRIAFLKGPPFFTAATSLEPGRSANDPNFILARALQIASLNGHDEAGVNLLHRQGGEWAFYNWGDRWTYGLYLYKAAKQFDVKFRLSWHWNIAAGDPYYALDCREDDYAWGNATPDGQLTPSIEFERIAAGLDDYRYLLTLARLAKAKAGSPAAKAAETLIDGRMAAFHLGQRDHDRLFGVQDWTAFREQLANAIEALQ